MGLAGRHLALLISRKKLWALSVEEEAAGILIAETLTYVRRYLTKNEAK